jgi:hypothetical protein
MPGRFIAPDRSEWLLDLARPGGLEACVAGLPRTDPGELARLFRDRALLAGVFEFLARTPAGLEAARHPGLLGWLASAHEADLEPLRDALAVALLEAAGGDDELAGRIRAARRPPAAPAQAPPQPPPQPPPARDALGWHDVLAHARGG